jgi:hypothetical protein
VGTDDAARRRIALIQSLFYVVSGIWPVLHIRSFEAISGSKVDRWLVKTVGGLIAVVGAALGLAVRRNRVTPEIELVATGSAGVLATIDVVYVAKRRISPIYLLDALAEAALIAGWLRARISPGQ